MPHKQKARQKQRLYALSYQRDYKKQAQRFIRIANARYSH